MLMGCVCLLHVGVCTVSLQPAEKKLRNRFESARGTRGSNMASFLICQPPNGPWMLVLHLLLLLAAGAMLSEPIALWASTRSFFLEHNPVSNLVTVESLKTHGVRSTCTATVVD